MGKPDQIAFSRLILSAEKKRAEQRRSLANQGKSRSLDNDQEHQPEVDNIDNRCLFSL